MQSTNSPHDRESGVARRGDGTGPARPPQLGEVVRDAMDHAQVIARDAVTLGRLEAEHVIDLAKVEAQTAFAHAKIEARNLAQKARAEGEEVMVRAAFGAVAVVVGAVGMTLLSVAAFLGLGALIPSLAVRFAIFAVVYLAIAALAARQVGRRRRVTVRHTDERLQHIASIHPIDGEEV